MPHRSLAPRGVPTMALADASEHPGRLPSWAAARGRRRLVATADAVPSTCSGALDRAVGCGFWPDLLERTPSLRKVVQRRVVLGVTLTACLCEELCKLIVRLRGLRLLQNRGRALHSALVARTPLQRFQPHDATPPETRPGALQRRHPAPVVLRSLTDFCSNAPTSMRAATCAHEALTLGPTMAGFRVTRACSPRLRKKPDTKDSFT